MKRLPILTLMIVALASSSAFAQPAQAPQGDADAYRAWYEANAAKDEAKALTLAKEYVAKYPNGANVKYLRDTWIPAMRDRSFYNAVTQKNLAEMLKIGEETLGQDPNNLDYLYLIAYEIRADELSANPPNMAHSGVAADDAQRAIKLIEEGKTPQAIPKDKWNKEQALAGLHRELGVIAAQKNETDQALGEYKKAIAADPKDGFSYFQCGYIQYQHRYQPATEKYQALPEDDRSASPPKPDVKAALDDVGKAAEGVIDCWAHYLAITPTGGDAGQSRAQVEKVAADLYAYRHPDAPTGFQKLVDGMKK